MVLFSHFSLFLILITINISLIKESDGQFLPIFDWVRSFFSSYEEPTFTSLRNLSQDVEERLYPSKYWVCNEQFLTPETKDSKTSEMFMTLYRYFQGRNDKNQKLEMTVPISTKVDHRNGNLRSYEMCFFIPSEFQEAPPKPLAPESTPSSKQFKIRLIKFPELRVYAKTFGGYSSLEVEQEQFGLLSNLLKNESIPYFEEDEGDRATYFYNGYDSPTKFWSRRNEIWLLAKDTNKNINQYLATNDEQD